MFNVFLEEPVITCAPIAIGNIKTPRDLQDFFILLLWIIELAAHSFAIYTATFYSGQVSLWTLEFAAHSSQSRCTVSVATCLEEMHGLKADCAKLVVSYGMELGSCPGWNCPGLSFSCWLSDWSQVVTQYVAAVTKGGF